MLTFKSAQVIKYYVMFAFLFVQTVYDVKLQIVAFYWKTVCYTQLVHFLTGTLGLIDYLSTGLRGTEQVLPNPVCPVIKPSYRVILET